MNKCCFQATVEIDELAKFASEASEKMKNLEPVTSDADAIVEQLHDYKVCWLYGECHLWYTDEKNYNTRIVTVALWNRADHYIFILSFVLSCYFFFFSRLKRAACGLLQIQDVKIVENLPSGDHCTTLLGYIFATKVRIDNRKKLVKQQYLLHMSPQYGELRPTSG